MDWLNDFFAELDYLYTELINIIQYARVYAICSAVAFLILIIMAIAIVSKVNQLNTLVLALAKNEGMTKEDAVKSIDGVDFKI